MNIYDNITQLVGNTPLVRLSRFSEGFGLCTPLVAKVEAFNPLSSAKDRVACALIADAEEKGMLAPGGLIIESTSGNTGVGLAFAAAAKGYRLILTMPSSMSEERKRLLSALGATLVLTDPSKGMQGAVDEAHRLHSENPGSIMAGQFTNPANPQAHYRTTGQEIWRDTDGAVDIFVAGIGTGGTVSGVGRALREHKPGVTVVGVEPAGSPLLTEGRAGPHKIQGIGANFIPENLDRDILSRVVTVTDDEAATATRQLAVTEGILVGISSGAALAAAVRIAKESEHAAKQIVVLLPDTGERYLSTGLFQNIQ
ncbi:MAG: cysteine synthase A [Angelakisella sp.]